jgi:succinate dehydrogenase/fumarate reductase flavoprotein subunit
LFEPKREDYDVIVVGYGFAGAVAAIAAHDAGARVLIVEKNVTPGGISVCSAGGIRVTSNANSAFSYLKATNAGTTPDDVLHTLAEGMENINGFVLALANEANASTKTIKAKANYPFEGYESFGFISITDIVDFDMLESYPDVKGMRGGARLFQVLQRNVDKRQIEVALNTSVQRLTQSTEGEINGIRIGNASVSQEISARQAVILACGGFEASPEMQKQYWPEGAALPAAFLGNTGDGIRMAQAVGADLWHMWHYHGTYGIKHPDPSYPFAIRLSRLPDWIPGEGFPDHNPFALGGKSDQPVMPWIILDQSGKRFMNEYPPYLQDTGHRPFAHYDPDSQTYPRQPAWMLLDDEGKKLYPLGMPSYHHEGVAIEWSDTNQTEIDNGFLHQASDINELALKTGLSQAGLQDTITRWNNACEQGLDNDFSRPPETMRAIIKPPFVYAALWPVVSNTQGGPVHDARQRVLDPFGTPIPGLYAAGELGSCFGHLYMSGGNIAECFIGGRIAGQEAAKN